MIDKIKAYVQKYLEEIHVTNNIRDLEAIKTAVLGKNGIVASMFKQINSGSTDIQDKKPILQQINDCKNIMLDAIKRKKPK